MSHFPPEVVQRWYADDCQGTSKCKTLFMVSKGLRFWAKEI